MKRRSSIPRLSHRGFTLMELLVTMAMTAMISTLLWQGLSQMFRVERLLQHAGVDGQLGAVRREWLRALIESSLVEQTGAERQLQGNAHEFTLVSAEGLNLPGVLAGKLLLRFETAPSSSRQRLVVTSAENFGLAARSSSEAAKPVELLTWVGAPGLVRFLDARGNWHDQWPPPPSVQFAEATGEDDQMRRVNAAVPRLPRALWLDLGSEAGGPLMATLSVTEKGRLRRAQSEQ